ncbi:MAG: hypothetical protein Cons2KO_02400 [Congregibacter sp.]
MVRNQGATWPQTKSLIGAVVVAALVFIGSQSSPVLGYLLALSALVMILVAALVGSIWPTQSKRENPLVFSLFWGLMVGAIAPFLVSIYLEGGASAVIEIFTSEP